MKLDVIIRLVNTAADLVALLMYLLSSFWQYIFRKNIRDKFIDIKDVDIDLVGLRNQTRANVMYGVTTLCLLYFSFNVSMIAAGFTPYQSTQSMITSVLSNGVILFVAINKYKVYKQLSKYHP